MEYIKSENIRNLTSLEKNHSKERYSDPSYINNDSFEYQNP